MTRRIMHAEDSHGRRLGRPLIGREVDIHPSDVNDIFRKGDQGKSVDLVVPTGAVGAQGVAQQVISSEGDGGKAQALTVFFNDLVDITTGQKLFPPTGFPSVIARVSWGTAGIFCDAEIDVVRGGRVTVVGSSLQVALFVELFEQNAVPAGRIRAGASAGYVPNASPLPPTRTLPVPALAASTATLQVPPFAQSVTFHRVPSANAVLVEFLSNAGTVLYTETVAVGATCPEIRIAADVRFVRVGPTITLGRLIFRLVI